MKAKLLLEKLKEFKALLKEHYDLWSKSLDGIFPDYPIRNAEKLKEQQIQLVKIFYQIDEYLRRFSKRRIMYSRATGIRWDIYESAIGDVVAHIKGDSIRNALLDLEGIIGLLETENPEKEITAGYVSSREKRVFVSHGTETEALNKIEKLLRALGITPVIVKNEPSLGKSVDDLVEEQMGSC